MKLWLVSPHFQVFPKMTEFLSKTSNEAANINECENLNDNSNLFTIVVENVYLNQIHYLNDINILTHFHNLLINYCKSHGMDLTSFVFLVPSDDSSTRNISWRVATPSMRVKDAILEYLFDVKERRIFIQCVLKKDVSKYVAWNNCDSKKYTKVSTNAVKSVIYPSAPTPKVMIISSFFILQNSQITSHVLIFYLEEEKTGPSTASRSDSQTSLRKYFKRISIQSPGFFR